MGTVKSSIHDDTVPSQHYIGEMERLSGEIYKLEEQIGLLKSALIQIKVKITDVQFYEPDDYDLNDIVALVEKSLEVK
jgi:SMC interacting uncharacterized protein involved in chromosome segregation